MGTRPKVEGQPTPEEVRALKGAEYYAEWDSGYSSSNRPAADGGLRPDRFAGRPGGVDPGEIRAWTDCNGHPENVLGRDELLDNVMLYWVTETAASSARLYWESFGPKRRKPHTVTVPTGVAVFPKEIVTPVRRWMEG